MMLIIMRLADNIDSLSVNDGNMVEKVFFRVYTMEDQTGSRFHHSPSINRTHTVTEKAMHLILLSISVKLSKHGTVVEVCTSSQFSEYR